MQELKCHLFRLLKWFTEHSVFFLSESEYEASTNWSEVCTIENIENGNTEKIYSFTEKGSIRILEKYRFWLK